jgi:hypothetical protein
MPTRAERCQARAEECLLKAMVTHDPDVRRQFMGLASQWHQFAEQIEKQESRPSTH